MMIADMTYDGAALVLATQHAALCEGATAANASVSASRQSARRWRRSSRRCAGERWDDAWSAWPSPAGSLLALPSARSVGASALVVVAHAGFWTHSTLVLLFLNLLPHSKHFHIITAIPNVFLRRPRARRTAGADGRERPRS